MCLNFIIIVFLFSHFDHDNIMGTPDDRRKNPPTCFAGTGRRESDSDEEDPTERTPRGGGVAIAPPPSLQESSPAPSLDTSPARTSSNPPQYGASVAAKIMAKYGFKVIYNFITFFKKLIIS